jgi:hypothetical protein
MVPMPFVDPTRYTISVPAGTAAEYIKLHIKYVKSCPNKNCDSAVVNC